MSNSKLCEADLLVEPSLRGCVRRASGGTIPARIEDDSTATAKTELNASKADADIQGGKDTVRAGSSSAGARDRRLAGARKPIMPHRE